MVKISFLDKKKLVIPGGIAAAIAIVVVIGFSIQGSDIEIGSNFESTSKDLMLKIDETSYKKADIISVSGDTISYADSIELSIENSDGEKIWNEYVKPKDGGQFSTLLIAGGGGWENDGVYTLKAKQSDLTNEIMFNFRV